METMELGIPRQLRKAASIIEKRGHAQHRFGTPDGPVCLASALAEANGSAAPAGLFGYETQPMTKAGEALVRDIFQFPHSARPRNIAYLCSYNNRKTTEDVVGQLRKTADKLELEVFGAGGGAMG